MSLDHETHSGKSAGKSPNSALKGSKNTPAAQAEQAGVSHSVSWLAQYARPLSLLLGALLLFVGVTVAVRSVKETRNRKAREDFYAAKKVYDDEVKAVTPKPPAPPKADPKSKTPPSAPKVESVEFKKMDVNQVFSKSIQSLKAVGEKHKGTSPGFQAEMMLGNLYLDHGSAVDAIPHYLVAAENPPGDLEKMSAYFTLAQAQESAGKCNDAVGSVDRALNTGNASLKGDLLMTQARCYETLNDSAKAKAAYERIVNELPGTPYARLAEIQRAKLK
jgi:predicted negative regulator of RcsB-dependent stress response